MSAAEEPVFLDAAGVAAHLGIRRQTVWHYVWRGDMPDPDIVYLGHKLWLAETIDNWRRQKGKHRHNRKPLERRELAQPRRPVKIKRAGAVMPAQPKAMRKRTSAGASEMPATSSIAPHDAKKLATELRAEGNSCTAADVMVLADHDGQGLDHEREQLRLRVLRRLGRLK